MPFVMPEKVKPTVSAGTARVYKTHLNRLSEYGCDSVEYILKYPRDVVSIIESICEMEDGTPEEVKQTARVYYSAVFFVLYGHPMLSDPDNPLRRGFRKQSPSKTVSGDDWLPIEKFKAKK